jgi:RimJ/RimL family protein N-acetyltransferase
MHSFTTERLLIRPLIAEDEAFFCQQLTNEKVMRYTGGTLALDEASKVFQRSLRANERAKNGGKKSVLTWAILCLNTETIIGTQTLSFLVLPHNAEIIQQAEVKGIKQAEIGIVLKSEIQGKGVGKEAIEALVQYGFNSLTLEQINAFYADKNIASRKLFTSLNFTLGATSQLKNVDYSHQHIENNNTNHVKTL